MKKQTANSHPGVSRRMFLEGLGASIPLPFLASVASPSRAKAAACTPTPKRFVAWFTPNGYMKQHIVPSGTGANYDLKGTLAPLGTLGIQSNVSVLSNLHRRDAAFSGNGAHGFMTPAFLTCVKLNPSAVTAGTRSADQVAADTLACDSNKVASLRIGLNSVFGGGEEYNSVFSQAISYSPAPMLPNRNPQAVFDDLFAGTNPMATDDTARKRRAKQLSVLDYSLDRLNRLRSKLSADDKPRLDAYTTEIRNLEQQLAAMQTTPTASCDGGTRPAAASNANMLVQSEVDAFIDLQVIALQCGLTNVITFMMAPGGSFRSYQAIGVATEHHNSLSHHEHPQWATLLPMVERWQVEQWAKFVRRLDDAKESDGSSILSHSAVILGSELADGAAHSWVDLPLLVAGSAGGGFSKVGQHIPCNDAPMARALLAILKGLDVPVTSFAGHSDALSI
ncbi:MAG: DUF1552 domain-containing protein [Polyangiales bacterium]